MNISILAVGTELLMGKTVNTNATELSKMINDLGHSVKYHLTIGDNPDRLASSLEFLLGVSDMVITTGGLGPTQDDLTKETIAKAFDLELKLDQKALDMMVDRFKNFNVTMTENNKKQAYLPEGSITMYNDRGTAPGFISSSFDKIVAALPGPPREMRMMFDKSLKPFLLEKSDKVIKSEYINLFGIGESSAETRVEDIISNQTNPTIAIYANIGQVSLRITALANTEDEASELLKPVVAQITDRLKDYVLGYGEKSLVDYTFEALYNSPYTLTIAESCTGGMIASELINYSGASKFLDRSFVTYSNEAKEEVLSVSKDILNKYGAVSEETCFAMLEGLEKNTTGDIHLAVTGIAGPTGGSPDKPIGLVYIGTRFNGKSFVKKFNFTGDRYVIRRRSMLSAMHMLLSGIKDTCK